MLPATAPTVTVYRGDTTPILSIQFKNPDGTVKDVSDTTWLSEWRLDVDATAHLDFTVDADDAVNGWLHIVAPADITAQMTGSGVWDLQATETDGSIITKVRGKTKFVEDVTHT